MARPPCDGGTALSWEHVTFVASPTSIMANRIALSFGDVLEGYFDVSQNCFQIHSTTNQVRAEAPTTKPVRDRNSNQGVPATTISVVALPLLKSGPKHMR